MVGLPIPAEGGKIPSIDDMPSFSLLDGLNRFTREAGGWIVKDGRCYIDMILKCTFSMLAMPYPLPDTNETHVYSSGVENIPATKLSASNVLSCVMMKKSDNNYTFYSFGRAVIAKNIGGSGVMNYTLNLGSFHDITAADNIYFHIYGSYEVA